MKIVDFSTVEWKYSDKHDCSLGVHPDLPANDFADIVLAKIKPNHTLKPHYHKRPRGGYEAFLFYSGGFFDLVKEKGSIETFRTKEPVFMHFLSNEVHGIRNRGTQDLVFAVVCAPKFDPNEEIFVQ